MCKRLGLDLKAEHAFLDIALWLDSEEDYEALERLFPDSHPRRVLLNAIRPIIPRQHGEVGCVELYGRALSGGRHIHPDRTKTLRLNRALNCNLQQPSEQGTAAQISVL